MTCKPARDVLRPSHDCEWCQDEAKPGQDLCGDCMKKFEEAIRSARLTKKDREIERFLASIRAVGGKP